jgi:hypothetical protein
MSRTNKTKTAQASHKTSPTRLVSWFLLTLGLISIAFSINLESSVLAFIGLGLTFWGALTLYITTEKYVKEILLNSTLLPRLANMDKILTELGYHGKAVYLPPKYLKDPETSARLWRK